MAGAFIFSSERRESLGGQNFRRKLRISLIRGWMRSMRTGCFRDTGADISMNPSTVWDFSVLPFFVWKHKAIWISRIFASDLKIAEVN